jgi:hypothetical protein
MQLCRLGGAAQGGSGSCSRPSLLCDIIVFGNKKAAAAVNVYLTFFFHSALTTHAVETLVAGCALLNMKTCQWLIAHRSPATALLRDAWCMLLIATHCMSTFILRVASLKHA